MRSRPITILWRWPATDHKPHCRHVPINKIWRQTNSTPQTGWRRSHMAGIYGNCSTREINTCFVLLARPGSPTDKLWDNCNRLYRGKCQNPTEQTNFSTAFGMFSYRRKVTENVLQSLSTQPILSFCQWLAHLIIYYTRLTALCPGLPGWAGTRNVKPIWILLKQETVSSSGISWAICKSASLSRQRTTPAPHHSVFYRPDALSAAQPTASKHWRHHLIT